MTEHQPGTSPAAVRAAITLTPNPFQKVSDTTAIVQDAIDAELQTMRELLKYIDEHIIDEYLVQGDCGCVLDDGPCGYCASRHAREAIASILSTHIPPCHK